MGLAAVKVIYIRVQSFPSARHLSANFRKMRWTALFLEFKGWPVRSSRLSRHTSIRLTHCRRCLSRGNCFEVNRNLPTWGRDLLFMAHSLVPRSMNRATSRLSEIGICLDGILAVE